MKKPWTVTANVGGLTQWGQLHPESGEVEPIEPKNDPRLPGLSTALARGTLISYRAGRRAVVTTDSGFIKVVRPERAARLANNHRQVSAAGLSVRHPSIMDNSGDSGKIDQGLVAISRVPGRPLNRLLKMDGNETWLSTALDQMADGLAEFHRIPAPRQLEVVPADSAAQWIRIVRRAEPTPRHRGVCLATELEAVARDLPPLPTLAATVVHGDLHDKNIFWWPADVSLVDLDGLRLGAAEDDLANLGAHLQLRAMQAGQLPVVGQRRAARLYRRYDRSNPISPERLAAVERHTFFRLACLYAFRLRGRPLVPELLSLAAHDR